MKTIGFRGTLFSDTPKLRMVKMGLYGFTMAGLIWVKLKNC